MLEYTYETFSDDVKKLTELARPFAPDTIIAIARGGMMLGQMMGYGLDVRNVQSIHIESYDGHTQRDNVAIFGACDLSRSKRVLIVDDIVDSGKTLDALIRKLSSENMHVDVKSAVIFYKTSACIEPDFKLHEATEWIDFFWESDYV